MEVIVRARIDVEALRSAIEDAADSISSLTGLGFDGNSVYDIASVDVAPSEEVADEFIVTFQMERTEGKFARKDDVGAALEEALGNEEITIPIEII